MEYRRGDVRDPDALRERVRRRRRGRPPGLHDHGNRLPADDPRDQRRGHADAFAAAAAAGAQRFVYASSVAAYGFHPDNPVGMTEDWPVRPAARSVLRAGEGRARAAAAIEQARRIPDVGLYLLRPPIVLGPHAVGAKDVLPAPVAAAAQRVLAARPARSACRSRCPLPTCRCSSSTRTTSARRCSHAWWREGPPGAYNIAGDGVVTVADVVRELGLTPVPVPAGLTSGAARAAALDPAAAVRPAGRRVGRGGQPPRDHGHDQGQARARLATQVHRARGAARHRCAATRDRDGHRRAVAGHSAVVLGPGARRHRLARTLNAAYAEGLLSERTLAHRLDDPLRRRADRSGAAGRRPDPACASPAGRPAAGAQAVTESWSRPRCPARGRAGAPGSCSRSTGPARARSC